MFTDKRKIQTLKIWNFRPIILVTSLNKIIAKVLPMQLHRVLHETVFSSHDAFVERRQTLDARLTTNEVLDKKRRSEKEDLVYKLIFRKIMIMRIVVFFGLMCKDERGFSPQWRSWKRVCLSLPSPTILVNGNAKGLVKATNRFETRSPLLCLSFYISSKYSK